MSFQVLEDEAQGGCKHQAEFMLTYRDHAPLVKV